MGKLRPGAAGESAWSQCGSSCRPGALPAPRLPCGAPSPLTSSALVLQAARWRGLGSLCRKVCCVALPLQLLLLLFLLLLFLLPVGEENRSCFLANNFARSLTLMLRYDGPPPT